MQRFHALFNSLVQGVSTASKNKKANQQNGRIKRGKQEGGGVLAHKRSLNHTHQSITIEHKQANNKGRRRRKKKSYERLKQLTVHPHHTYTFTGLANTPLQQPTNPSPPPANQHLSFSILSTSLSLSLSLSLSRRLSRRLSFAVLLRLLSFCP